MKLLLKWWRGHGTKAIGFAQGTVAALAAVAGLVPDAHLKYWLGASAVLTFWRGFVNSQLATPESIARNHEGLDGDTPR